MAWTSSSSHFWRFPSFARGSELCKAQETRGSKFIYEFGRNSTVYCFVASENKTAPTHKIQNLSHFLKVYQRVFNFILFCQIADEHHIITDLHTKFRCTLHYKLLVRCHLEHIACTEQNFKS